MAAILLSAIIKLRILHHISWTNDNTEMQGKQVYLYSTIQAQGNSKCFTGAHKLH